MRGRAYRRAMRDKKDRRLRNIITNCGYIPHAGYIDWDLVDGVWQPVGKYIKYPKIPICKSTLKSNQTVKLDAQKFHKRAMDIGNAQNIGG